MIGLLHGLTEKFQCLLQRKAFLHWYTGEGMDDMDMTEAYTNILDLISEYQHYSDITVAEVEAEHRELREARHRERRHYSFDESAWEQSLHSPHK